MHYSSKLSRNSSASRTGISYCPLLLIAILSSLTCSTLHAQAGLRESLERLDTNENGKIDPDEITPLARPYLERIATARRISLREPCPIDRLQEAARIYYAFKNGVAGREVKPNLERTVREFGAEEDEPLVPEFGLAEVRYPYTQDDLDEADRTLRRNDRNKDGYIDAREAARGDWTHRNPFEMDLNKDGRLSRLELGQRYARRRLLRGDASALIQKARRTGNGIKPSVKEDGRDSRDRRSRTNRWLTYNILERFDKNRNGRLEQEESAELGIPTSRIDVDRDGVLSRDELQAYMTVVQEEAAETIEGLPGWFYELDTNRDQQIALREFAIDLTEERMREFLRLDANDDGLLTAKEVMQSNQLTGGSYTNDQAVLLPPRRSIVSEIEIPDDFLIADLNVRLNITHTYASYLDAYLTGPDGQRIELFTAIGGSDDHFEQTTFDDQSREPITKARAPFRGSYIPEGLLKRQPGLSHFNGKSAKGVWQLVIRCSRSERFGMLHSWSLITKSQDDLPSDTVPPDAATSESTDAVESTPTEQ